MGLTAPRSLNEKLLRPSVGVILIRQSTGLNAASPWNRSAEIEKKSRLTNELLRPKNWNEPGREVLSNPPEAGVGIDRGSKNSDARPETSRKVLWP